MATDLQAAAERLGRVNEFEDPEQFKDVVYRGEHYGPYEDQCILAEAMERELDQQPIDDVFARSVAVRERNRNTFILRESPEFVEMTRIVDRWLVETKDSRIVVSTQGELMTACRLFGVDVQAKAEVR